MRVRAVANELVAIYSVDALLAPVGLLAAFAAATEPWASLLVPPLLGLIAIFAREREARGATRSRASASWSESAECSGEMGPVVRHHHERFDGTGYPDGLRDEEIPLASRVISASDAFHAMISERPYREPLSRRRHQRAARERRRPVRPPRSWPRLSESGRRGTPPSRDEAGGQPDTDPSSEHKLEPAIG